MSHDHSLDRRSFLRLVGFSAVGSVLAACGAASTANPTVAPPVEPVPTSPPAAPAARTVRIAVGGWAEQGTKDLLEQTNFTKQTGINVEVILRTDTKEAELARMVSAVQAGSSPYDVLDFEDELATTFSQAGYMLPLDDLLPQGFWDDFPPSMIENHKIWSTREGELFRVLHNWEMPFWFYRKDWFTEKGVEVPKTWDEVRTLGPVFTDEAKGVWASEDGLIKGAFLNVYLAWITLQAGGSPFDLGDPYRQALEYVHDLMYVDKVLNPASLQKDYNQQNADYIADRVAFMRQWPFLYDVARSDDNKAWFTEDKLQIALPPAGPGGIGGSTYAAGWGFGVVRTSPNIEAAKELFQFLVNKETAVTAVQTNFWFLNARHSVLQAAEGKGIAAPTQMYSDAGVIGVRPFHPRFVEALTIIEDTAAGFLTNQSSIDAAISQAQEQLAKLA